MLLGPDRPGASAGGRQLKGAKGSSSQLELRYAHLVHLDGLVVLGVLERVRGQDSESVKGRRVEENLS